ncbi:hypothetical protein [Deinococcus peraridilitoris]|uniref:Uncharacterized protein n=1 Tax=Deinococcus peraridilitoris (strain DSM 19664 / LMG 22246 / CIP 109416 / KR-200) TaxID=937777 RepID=K9ZW61_DEIPD|nr:hypothetical protein [Deinococcus peraridilitoris]AFZ65878.1 hypothetical protein Deipe_0277 [Deinococcus peraridilitoris DSM 19664]
MYPLFAAWLVLGLTWIVGKRIERATPDWTRPADLSPSLWGVALGLFNATFAFLMLLGQTGTTSAARSGLLLSVALTCIPTLWWALGSTNPRVAALWRAFFTAMLLLSCLLALASGVTLRS